MGTKRSVQIEGSLCAARFKESSARGAVPHRERNVAGNDPDPQCVFSGFVPTFVIFVLFVVNSAKLFREQAHRRTLAVGAESAADHCGASSLGAV